MTTPPAAITAAADRLERAAASRTPIPPLRTELPAGDIDTAYLVQRELVTRRIRSGATRIGRKIGLTAPVVQQQLGVDQPDFGALLDVMQVASGDCVARGDLIQPKVEGEIAFVLGADLDGSITAESVRDAVASAHCAIEIVDSRITNWDISIVDTVADNASCGLFVMAEAGVPLSDLDTVAARMTLARNGEVASEGTGQACLGDPLTALAWLARAAAGYGDPLRAGEVVLSGALGPMVVVDAGDRITVTISGLGSTSVSFAGPASGTDLMSEKQA